MTYIAVTENMGRMSDYIEGIIESSGEEILDIVEVEQTGWKRYETAVSDYIIIKESMWRDNNHDYLTTSPRPLVVLTDSSDKSGLDLLIEKEIAPDVFSFVKV